MEIDVKFLVNHFRKVGEVIFLSFLHNKKVASMRVMQKCKLLMEMRLITSIVSLATTGRGIF